VIDPPRIVQTDALLTAVIHLTIPRSEIQRVMGPAIQEVLGVVAAQGLAPSGPVFSHHFAMRPETFDFEVGVPVVAPVNDAGRVRAGRLPSVAAALTTYRGPYEGLGAAWGELEAWMRAHGHAAAPDLWERYTAGPESSPDLANWRTDLVRPIVAARRAATMKVRRVVTGHDAAGKAVVVSDVQTDSRKEAAGPGASPGSRPSRHAHHRHRSWRHPGARHGAGGRRDPRRRHRAASQRGTAVRPTVGAGLSNRRAGRRRARGYAGFGAVVSARTYDVSLDGTRFLMIKEPVPRRRSLVVVENWTKELRRLVPTK
jgi:effector-binding domain-containing protein